MSERDTKLAFEKTGVKPLQFAYSVKLGCDPEFFFTSDGKVIGSEKVLPKDGLEESGTEWRDESEVGKFIIDGVQAELNPHPETCRALLANGIHRCFADLFKKLKDDGKSVDVSFAPVVDISQAELDSLSEKSKVFGCAPSDNVNFDKKKAKIKVNPKKYLKRSAGGHIHLGEGDDELDTIEDYEDGNNYEGIKVRDMHSQVLQNPRMLVPLLDLVVANTCVLLDRDPSNAERRKNYGRVGEYRLKDYGIEYRTLSNFWLRSYQLMSFVMGLSRMTCHMAQQSRNGTPYITKLMDAVPRGNVIKAVQENDFRLAYQNFRAIEPILVAAGADNDYDYPISRCTIKEFHHFVKKGIDYWFKDDVFQHWVHLPDGHDKGWESFARNWVRKDMNGLDVMKTKKIVAARHIRARRQPAAVAAE